MANDTEASPAETEREFGSPTQLIEALRQRVDALKADNAKLREENAALKLSNIALQATAEEAKYDDLTRVLKRNAWEAAVEARLAEGKPTGVFYLDIDAFKIVNDTFGHEIGDTVLVRLVEHLRRRDDIVGRRGGDEFCIAVSLDAPDRDDNLRSADPQASMEAMRAYIQKVIQEIEQEIANFVREVDDYIRNQTATKEGGEGLEQRSVYDLGFGVSIGYAISTPERPLSLEQLFPAADAAMYKAKHRRKSNQDTPPSPLQRADSATFTNNSPHVPA